jgi:hypothetical protein
MATKELAGSYEEQEVQHEEKKYNDQGNAVE